MLPWAKRKLKHNRKLSPRRAFNRLLRGGKGAFPTNEDPDALKSYFKDIQTVFRYTLSDQWADEQAWWEMGSWR